jgi:hypothetical protein
MIAQNPVRHANRFELSQYICDLHNKVNQRLGKEQFECATVLEFWGGDPGVNNMRDFYSTYYNQ